LAKGETPDGRRVALTLFHGVLSGVVLVLDGHTGETLLSCPCASPQALALAPGGQWLATVERGVLSVTGVPGGSCRERVSGHGGEVTTVAFAPDGSTLASADSEGVRVWELATGDTRSMLETAPAVESLAFMPDGRALVALTSVGAALEPAEAVAWDLNTGTERSRAPAPGMNTPLAVTPDARYALWATTRDPFDAARCAPTLHVWDLARPRPLQVDGVSGRDGVARYITVTSDGREATVFSDYTWWKVELRTLRRVAQGHVTYRGRLLDLGVGLWRLGQLFAVASGLIAPPEPEPREPMVGSSTWSVPSSRGRYGVLAEAADARRRVFKLRDVGPYEPHGQIDLGTSNNIPTCMAVSPDASRVAFGTRLGVVMIFRQTQA
jgi:WD40 repeat protein